MFKKNTAIYLLVLLGLVTLNQCSKDAEVEAQIDETEQPKEEASVDAPPADASAIPSDLPPVEAVAAPTDLAPPVDVGMGAPDAGDGSGTPAVAVESAESTDSTGSPASSENVVYFEFDSFGLKSDAQGVLKGIAEKIKASGGNVRLEGHCDQRGSSEYNLALGERRAKAAKDGLIKLGVPAGSIKTISYGKEKPIATGNDEESWAQNRRVEFIVQ